MTRALAPAIVAALRVSRQAVTPTTPEPSCDLSAQLRALCDPAHPKDALFVAAGSDAAALVRALPHGVRAVARAEGVLLTTDAAKARAFGEAARISDDDLARLLGYPETKADAIASGAVTTLQARDRDGAVVTEAVVATARLARAVVLMRAQLPPGGALVVLTPAAALLRRAVLRTREQRPPTITARRLQKLS